MASVRSLGTTLLLVSNKVKRSGNLQILIQNYVGNFSDSIEQAYKTGLQETDENDWLNLTNSGIGFNQLPSDADLASSIKDNVTSLFYMKAIK